jgi:predicted permease
VAAWSFTAVSYSGNGRAAAGYGEVIAGDYFGLLGVVPVQGRVLQEADHLETSPSVVVISHRLWVDFFDGAADTVGQLLRIHGRPFQVVGIVSSTFVGLFNNGLTPTALWLPAGRLPAAATDADRFSVNPTDQSRRWLLVKGRLRPETSFEQASADVVRIAKELDSERPIRSADEGAKQVSRRWTAKPAVSVAVNENADRGIRYLTGAVIVLVVLVLVAACTNLANLVLAHGLQRQHDLVVRLTLGASRWQVLRGIILESAILAVAGAVGGWSLTVVALRTIRPDVPVDQTLVLRLQPVIDTAVVGGIVVSGLIVMVFAGWLPGSQLVRGARHNLGAQGRQHVSAKPHHHRLLMAFQVAVSTVLLQLTLVFMFKVRQQETFDPGFDLDRLAVARVDFDADRIAAAAARHLTSAVLADLEQSPLSRGAAATTALPGFSGETAWIEAADSAPMTAERIAASAGVQRVLELTLRHGRFFTAADEHAAEPVAVLNESAAMALFGRAQIAGATLRLKTSPTATALEVRTIVGVIADASSPAMRHSRLVFVPLPSRPPTSLLFVMRTSEDAAASARWLVNRVTSADPGAAITTAGTGRAVVGRTSAIARKAAVLSGGLGIFALALSLSGLYGVVSELASQRRREIGIRLALGAPGRTVRWLLVRQGLAPAAIGFAVAAVVGTIVYMYVARRTLDVIAGPIQVGALGVMLLLFLGLLSGACYLPARRASRLDPQVLLKDL